MCEEMKNKEESEFKPIFDYITSNLEKYLISINPWFIDFKNTSEAADSFSD